jgi:hypothetical protein
MEVLEMSQYRIQPSYFSKKRHILGLMLWYSLWPFDPALFDISRLGDSYVQDAIAGSII